MRLVRVLLLLAALGPFLSPTPSRADEYVDSKGLIYLGRGAYPAAMGWYFEVLQFDPDQAGAVGGLAFAKCRVGRVEQAAAHLATVADSDEPLVSTARACVAAHRGDVAGALAHHEAASAASRFPFHIREWTRYLVDLGRWEAAEARLDEMRAAGWEQRSALALRAECLLGRGLVEEALLVGEQMRLERSGPRRTPDAETLLALATGDLGDAVTAAYPVEVTRFGSAHDAVVIRAEAMRRRGELDAAEREAGRRKREPLRPTGWAAVARITAELGDHAEAARWVDEASARWPDHPSLALSRAFVAACAGDTTLARAELDRARALGVPAWDSDVEREVAARIEAAGGPAR